MFDVIAMREEEKVKTIDPGAYQIDAEAHPYLVELTHIDLDDAKKWLDVGIDPMERDRSGTFIQKDRSVVHCNTHQEGVEMMGISQALTAYPWLGEYVWKNINVRPRTVIRVAEGGTLISNYVCLKPVGSLQMFPTTYLEGEGAVARFNSILVAGRGSHMDVGSRVVLSAPHTRAEIISRGITAGGTLIARGNLIGKVAGVKAHLECKGLILNDGLMHAVPELQGFVPGVEMSHEAAVGKIDQREIEYLMARGLDEETAVSTIVRGFLNVDIEGLPPGLREKLDKAVSEIQKDMM